MDPLTAETLGDFSFTGRIATIVKIAKTPQRAMEMLLSANLLQDATVDGFLSKMEFTDDMDEFWWSDAKKQVENGNLVVTYIDYDPDPYLPEEGTLHLFKDDRSTLCKNFDSDEDLEEWVKEQVNENPGRVFYIEHHKHSNSSYHLGKLVDSDKVDHSCDGIFISPPEAEDPVHAAALLQQIEDWANGECYAAFTKGYKLDGTIITEHVCHGFYGADAAESYLREIVHVIQ